MGSRVSIVIPARGDAVALARTLDYLDELGITAAVEIIIGASGDRDDTLCAIGDRARAVWPARPIRAGLMNAAAAEATGDALFFLHADSLPPSDAIVCIDCALEDDAVVGGAFEHEFQEPAWSLRAISLMNRVRYRLTHNYYGDQGMFVRTEIFRQLGGFKDCALMEDLDFSQRLKRVGRTVLVRRPVRTSGRRFINQGVGRTCAIATWLLLCHTVGVDVERYAYLWRSQSEPSPGSRRAT
jgi:rSAM/selenodomain-associated transferase 2